MKTSVYHILWGLFETNHLFKLKDDEGLQQLDKRFSEFSSANEKLISELVDLVNNRPEIVISLIRNFLDSNRSLTRLLTKLDVLEGKTKNPSKAMKMEMISLFWEIGELVRFQAYLLSGKNVDLEKLSDPNQVFGYFKSLGLQASQKEKINKIRNANNHTFSFDEDWIVGDNSERICRISELDIIYERLSKIFKWSFANFLMLLYYVPRFGILITLSLYTEISKNTRKYNDYMDTLVEVAPNLSKNHTPNDSNPNSGFIARSKKRVLDFYKGSILRSTILRFRRDNSRMTSDKFKKLVKKFDKRVDEFEAIMTGLKSDLSFPEYHESIDYILENVIAFRNELVEGIEIMPEKELSKFVRTLENSV